jgi:DNA-binding MarR family transcriptional regulator
MNNKQEQIVFYLYEFKNTPERGVGADPRLTTRGIAEGTQISTIDVTKFLRKLIDKAFVRPVLIGCNTYHYLTMKGYKHVEKVQQESLRLGLNEKGLSFGFEKSETKRIGTSQSEG